MIRNASVLISPPSSPTHELEEEIGISPEVKRWRKRVRKDRSKCYTKIQKLEAELTQKTREADKYRKRYARLAKKMETKPERKSKYKLKLIFKEKGTRSKLKQQLMLQEIVANRIK